MAAIAGSCHCGAVRIGIPRRPDYINECNCSLCSKLAWRCVYFASDEVAIDGELDTYVRSDIAEPMITLFRCAQCGCGTHWEPHTPRPHARMGINARLFDADSLDGVEVRQIDGRSW